MQYLPAIRAAGNTVTVHSLISNELLAAKYHNNGYGLGATITAYISRFQILLRRGEFDVLWIEKEALPWIPQWIERVLLANVPYVLDFDDAIFHRYDQHRIGLIRRLYGRRLDALMSRAKLIVAGNDYLAQRGRDSGARWVEIVPTVVDLSRYPEKEGGADQASVSGDMSCRSPRIVWIGSPSTVRYLGLLREPLRRLALTTKYTLRIIGGSGFDLPGVDVELVPWSEATEACAIRACDVGVMPLFDSPWERGKCGYKLIQYMASGLPVVASDVGVNAEIVKHGATGFLANSADEWIDALSRLLRDQRLRKKMGTAGRQRVEADYCLQRTGRRVTELLQASMHA